ncbi:hypothetical protein [Haloprofundus salinisoli]|uniref:hypothetical protein n=1 Tax=Haloprofundus salinisoli TaxID=2876193 RepID=UPI001CCF6685|nr:hypothetical protein [Haloprofundus salinisoli]
MTNHWQLIAVLGSVMTFLAVAPFIFGMIGLAANMSIETATPTMLEQVVRLFVGALVAMVPMSVGGMALYAFFQFAESMA